MGIHEGVGIRAVARNIWQQGFIVAEKFFEISTMPVHFQGQFFTFFLHRGRGISRPPGYGSGATYKRVCFKLSIIMYQGINSEENIMRLCIESELF